VSRHGGIAPAVRRRALLALTLREREEISRGLASNPTTEMSSGTRNPVSLIAQIEPIAEISL
jgi:hypothetical protein